MSRYNYRSLPPGCIRLLRLRPHEDDDAPIQCQLFEYSLASARRKGAHLYEALSYCWGSPTKSQTAIVDEGVLHITENLHAALRRLRDPSLERIMWIDAVCIDQNNLDEKGEQVRFMAEIYAKASCVIVWLEHVTGNALIDTESEVASQQAIRALEAAANDSTEARSDYDEEFSSSDDEEASSDHEQEAAYVAEVDEDRLAVEKLLGRPWFRRIWVVQEVAAARHVLIMCKFTEIDGQAFCAGLDRISGSLLLEDKDARSRIRSTVNLIKGATLRPKGMVNASELFSLRTSPLGYLIEIHHVREATDRRDKIYALLGMSIDKPTCLVPNYQMSWTDLFPHLIKSLLPDSLSVATIDEHETAMIKIRGCVIGTVSEVRCEDTWYGQQLVRIFPHQSNPYGGHEHLTRLDWSLQATTKRINRGDIVCLLQGTSLPTLVRAHQDYCSIVTIAINAKGGIYPPVESWRRNTQFEFLLVWSWQAETQPSTFNDVLKAQGLGSMSCSPLQIPEDFNTAVMLLETGQYYLAILKVHSVIIASDDVGESERPDAWAVARFLDVLNRVFLQRYYHEAVDVLRSLIGRRRGHVNITEGFLIRLTSAPAWEPMAFVLDTQGDTTTVTENILKAAADNKYCGEAIIEVLLSRREVQNSTIESTIIALVTLQDWRPDEEKWRMMEALLKKWKGNRIPITETILAAAATNTKSSQDFVMEQLGNWSGHQFTITEEVLVAAAENELRGDFLMSLLLRWKGGHVAITEKVLAAAATNQTVRRRILNCLFLVSDPPTVTNQVLQTAYQNLPLSDGKIALQLEMFVRNISNARY